MATIRSVSRVAREALEDGANAGSLSAEELALLDTSPMPECCCSAAVKSGPLRKGLSKAFSVEPRSTEENWRALDTLEDEFLAVARAKLDTLHKQVVVVSQPASSAEVLRTCQAESRSTSILYVPVQRGTISRAPRNEVAAWRC